MNTKYKVFTTIGLIQNGTKLYAGDYIPSDLYSVLSKEDKDRCEPNDNYNKDIMEEVSVEHKELIKLLKTHNSSESQLEDRKGK